MYVNDNIVVKNVCFGKICYTSELNDDSNTYFLSYVIIDDKNVFNVGC